MLRRMIAVLNGPATPSIGGYAKGEFWRRRLWLWALAYLGILIGVGALIVLFGASALMGLAAPLAILSLLIVWAFPDSDHPPLNWVSGLLFGFLVALLFWPDYLAFDFPGLPWVTALRLLGVPLAFAFLVSISVSSNFRQALRKRLVVAPVVHFLIIAFVAIALVSILLSSNISLSINKFFVAILYWIITFYAAVWVFSQDGKAIRLAFVIWGFALLTSLTGLLEWQMKSLPWAGSIPSFLAIDDPVVQNILSGKARATTGIYRIQSKFTTPLGFAEFLAFSMPFVLYFAAYAKQWPVRLSAMGSIPFILLTIIRTDSRLGFVGFVMSLTLFLFLWAVRNWRQRRESILGPAITIAYPLALVVLVGATFVIGRLRNLVWGTGAQSFSTMAREEQLDMAIPMILSRPWGYGIGQAASTLGFRNPAGVLTIDTYYVAVALEFGVIGFIIFYSIFLVSLLYGLKYLLEAKGRSELILMPVMITISIFVVVKSVFSQVENHPLIFILLGALVAICYRIKTRLDGETGV